jgi:hypothetical protein
MLEGEEEGKGNNIDGKGSVTIMVSVTCDKEGEDAKRLPQDGGDKGWN